MATDYEVAYKVSIGIYYPSVGAYDTDKKQSPGAEMGLSPNMISPVSAYQKHLLNTNRHLQRCPSHLRKSFATSPRCMGRFQVVLQVFIVEVCLGTMGAFFVPYQTVIIWPLLAGLLMGGQIHFCIEDLRTVLAFDLLLAVGLLVCI